MRSTRIALIACLGIALVAGVLQLSRHQPSNPSRNPASTTPTSSADVQCLLGKLRGLEVTNLVWQKRLELLETQASQPLSDFVNLSKEKALQLTAEGKNVAKKTAKGKFRTADKDEMDELTEALDRFLRSLDGAFEEGKFPTEGLLTKAEVKDLSILYKELNKKLLKDEEWSKKVLKQAFYYQDPSKTELARLTTALTDRMLDDFGDKILKGTRLERLRQNSHTVMTTLISPSKLSRVLRDFAHGRYMWIKNRVLPKLGDKHTGTIIIFGAIVLIPRQVRDPIIRSAKEKINPTPEEDIKRKEWWLTHRAAAVEIKRAWRAQNAALKNDKIKGAIGGWKTHTDTYIQLGIDFRNLLVPDVNLWMLLIRSIPEYEKLLVYLETDLDSARDSLKKLLSAPKPGEEYESSLEAAKSIYADAVCGMILTKLFEAPEPSENVLKEIRELQTEALNLVKDERILTRSLLTRTTTAEQAWSSEFADMDKYTETP